MEIKYLKPPPSHFLSPENAEPMQVYSPVFGYPPYGIKGSPPTKPYQKTDPKNKHQVKKRLVLLDVGHTVDGSEIRREHQLIWRISH